MYLRYGMVILCFWTMSAQGQSSTEAGKQRLDFARTYFELGTTGYPSFKSRQLVGARATVLEQDASIQPYLSWGGLHFWGHAEFYVVFPLQQLLGKSEVHLEHAVVTGMRLLPWSYRDQRVRPYVGASWSSVAFRQGNDAPTQYKDFSLVADAGLLYGSGSFMLRLGVNYFHNNTWQYPLSNSIIASLETPRFAVQLGLLYSFDSSKNEHPEDVETWNSYPRLARLGSHAERPGDFFIGIGPSSSFSLQPSRYTQETFPFLEDQISSTPYLDIAVGYQSSRRDWFAVLSFRNPSYETEGYGVRQTIKKYSLALEFSKFLVDYSGFAPYVGLNVAYDYLDYAEEGASMQQSLTTQRLEPGLTFGWDIVPGKTSEYLILRTNLRWYPFSEFAIDGQTFAFSQLEYNLIQAVFYPGRFMAGRKR